MPANFDFNSKGDQIDDAVIEPKRPIIDCHHHLWLAPESLITAMEQQDTVAAQTLAVMYRAKNRYPLVL